MQARERELLMEEKMLALEQQAGYQENPIAFIEGEIKKMESELVEIRELGKQGGSLSL